MKKPYLLLIAIGIFAVFLGGFQYVKTIKAHSNNEIWIGYNRTNKSRSIIDFKRVNLGSQSKVDQLEEILLFGKTIEKPKVDLGEYDIQLSFKVPDNIKSYNFLIWFTNNGALIKMNRLNKFHAYISLDNQDTNLVKEIIQYKKS